MLADVVEVDSKRDGSDPIHLEVRSLTESFVPSPGSRTEPGTSVRLHLKAEAIGTLDVLDRVRHFARHVEFPIEVRLGDGSAHEVVSRELMPLPTEMVQAASRVFRVSDLEPPDEARIADFHVAREEKGIQLGVTLFSETFSTESVRSYRQVDQNLGSQHGFLVGSHPQFAEIANDAWCELNFTGDVKLNLTADRTRIAEASPEVWNEVAELYSRCIELL